MRARRLNDDSPGSRRSRAVGRERLDEEAGTSHIRRHEAYRPASDSVVSQHLDKAARDLPIRRDHGTEPPEPPTTAPCPRGRPPRKCDRSGRPALHASPCTWEGGYDARVRPQFSHVTRRYAAAIHPGRLASEAARVERTTEGLPRPARVARSHTNGPGPGRVDRLLPLAVVSRPAAVACWGPSISTAENRAPPRGPGAPTPGRSGMARPALGPGVTSGSPGPSGPSSTRGRDAPAPPRFRPTGAANREPRRAAPERSAPHSRCRTAAGTRRGPGAGSGAGHGTNPLSRRSRTPARSGAGRDRDR